MLICAFLSVGPLSATVYGQSSFKVGDAVIVIRHAELRVDQVVVGGVSPGTLLHIGDIKDGRIWGSNGTPGWLDVDNVVTPEEAVSIFSEEIRRNPQDANAFRRRGWARRARKEFDKALADCDEALRLTPSFSAYNLRGLTWHDKAQYDKAIADFDQALKLAPDAAVYSNRGNAWLAKDDFEQALADYDESMRLDPNYVFAYIGRGSVLHLIGKYDDAIADYNSVLRLDPREWYGYYNRGLVWNDKREFDKAIADFGNALRLKPILALAYGNRGRTWYYKRDFDKAIADSIAAQELDPKDADWYNSVAWIRATCIDANFRNGPEALELAMKACELSSFKSFYCLATLGASFAELGRYDEAVMWQQMAIDVAKDPNTKIHLQSRLDLYRQGKPYRW
jgi:tetratricopeptide (TPR) repeat protein